MRQQAGTHRAVRIPSTRGIKYDPFEHASKMGIRVIYRDLTSANGFWLNDKGIIVIDGGLSDTYGRVTCAHELGHAAYGHDTDLPKYEVQADRWAAEWLLDYEEVLDVMKWAPDYRRVAQELGVTNRILRVYLNVHRLT